MQSNVLVNARIRLDSGEYSSLTGRAISLNPGRHLVVVEHELQRTEKVIFVSEGEKLSRQDIVVPTRANKRVDVTRALFDGAESATLREPPGSVKASVLPGSEVEIAPSADWKQGVTGPVLASTLLMTSGLIGGVFLGVRARQKEADLPFCRPNCSDARIHDVETSYQVANVAWSAAAIGLVSGVLVVWLQDKPGTTQRASIQSLGEESAFEMRWNF